MKTLLLLSFVLCLGFVAPAHAIIGNIGHSTNLDYAGVPVPVSIEQLFINVKANGAIPAGAVVALDLTAKDGATAVIAPVSGLAPVCVMVNACADKALCKCQTYGINSSVLFDVTNSSSVAGHKAVIATGNAGYISARAVDVATDATIGYFFDSVAASGSVKLFIKLL